MRVKFQKILFATDLSDASNRALPFAESIARKFSAKLYVCHALDFTTAGLYDASLLVIPARTKELREDVKQKITDLMRGSRVPWEPLIVEGDPALAVADAADANGVDLIVAATHGRSGLTRVLLGSVAERLLHAAHRPLMTIRTSTSEASGFESWPLRRILVGCDFSPDSATALEYAMSLAQEFESELHLLHAIEPTIYSHMDATAGAIAADLERAVEKTVKQKLEALVPKEVRAWCSVTTAFASGESHSEILKYAQQHSVDLIITGLRGHGLLDRMLIGSTTDRLVRKSRCPVLAVEAPQRKPS